MQVEFNCRMCNNKFRLYNEYIMRRDSISCPCCGNSIDSEKWKAVQDEIVMLKKKLLELNSNYLVEVAVTDVPL